MLSRHRFEAHRARFCRWCRYSSSRVYLISRHLQRAHPSIHPVQGERIWRLRDAPIEPTQRMNPVAEPLRELQNVYNPSMVEVRIPYSPAPTVDTHTTYVPTRKVTCTKSSLLGSASPAVSEWEQGGDDFTLGEEDTSDSVSKGVDGGDSSGVFPAVEDRVWETAMESTCGSGVALVPPLQLDMPSSFDDLCKVSSSSALPCHQSKPSGTQSQDPPMSSAGSSVPTPTSQNPILGRTISNSPLLQVSLADGSRACASSHDVLSQADALNPSSCRRGPCVDVSGLTSMSSWQELGSHLGSLLNQYRNAGPNPYLAELEEKARTFQETLAQVVESQQPTVVSVEARNLDPGLKDTSPVQVQCGLSDGVTRMCESGGETEVDGSDAGTGVGGTDAGSRTGGSDGVARMGESGSVIEVDGSDTGTGMGRSDAGTDTGGSGGVATLGDSGSGTGVDGSNRGTGTGGSEDVATVVESGGETTANDSDGRIRMGGMDRSDGGTATGGSDGDTQLDKSDDGIRTGRSDDVTGMSGSVGKTRTDGADAGTEMGRSDDVDTMVDTGGRTAADESGCGIIMGQSDGDTGTSGSDGVTEMDVSDGESRMSRSDRGTGMCGSGEGRRVCGSAVGTGMGIIDDGTGTGRSDGGTGMSRSLGLGVETGGCPVPVESEVSRGSTVQPGVSHSPVNDYVVWSPDVIASIPPRQSSIVCCVTDPELPLDLSQQPRESPRVLVGSAARWQEDSKIRKDRSGDIPTKPTQAWPKIMSSVMDIQHDNLPLTQDYRPLQNDPAFFFLGAPSHYVPGFQARQLAHIRERARNSQSYLGVRHVPHGVQAIKREEKAILPDGTIYFCAATWDEGASPPSTSFSQCHQARGWKIDRAMRNAARD